MSLSDHVSLTITIESVGIPRAGFGIPMILSHNASWGDRIRYYGSTGEVLADGFASDSPEYLAATAIFAQAPHPEQIAIGRAASAVTQRYEVNVVDVDNSTDYDINVEGEGFEPETISYTSDSASSVSEIHNGLVTALNAVVDKTYTAAFPALVYADNTFVGEADDDTLTMATALVVADFVFTAEADTEVFTKAAHTLLTGDGPLRMSNAGGALPAGVLTATDYWVIRIDADNFYLATTLANALAGTHLSITTDGTGVQTMADTAETRRVVAHTLITGDGPFQVSTTGGLPTGLIAATDYWIIRLSDYTFKLAASLALSLAGTALALTTDGTGVQTIADTVSTLRPSGPFTVTADATGNWFSLELVTITQATIKQTHAAGTIDEDLAAILLADANWYEITTLYNSKAYILEVAAWAEANQRIYAVDVNDTLSITSSYNEITSDDALAELFNFGYANTMYSYYPSPAVMFSAAWMGRWLPTDPGQSTPKFKTLAGVPPVVLTGTHRANLIARRANSYQRIASRNIAWEGTVGSTVFKFLDVTRNLHWLDDEIKKKIFGLMAGAEIIPYTPEGIAIVSSGLREAVQGTAINQGVLSNNPEPTVTTPVFEDIDATDKEERELNNVKFDGVLQGAVHKVRIVGSVSF